MRSAKSRRAAILAVQVAMLVAFLAAWEYVPQIGNMSERAVFLDPFFISSPSKVVNKLFDLMTGDDNSVLVWSYVWTTVSSALIGLVIGMTAGGLFGLLLSNSKLLSDIFQPFVVAVNAIPRIALIPIIVIIFGPTVKASVVIALMVVFFIAFYNAYEGGRTVAAPVLQNAMILGATRFQIVRRIRLPYAFAWMMATLPLATTFALLSVVTGEILTGTAGLGKLITQALIFSDAALTFAVVVVLSLVGITVTAAAGLVRRFVLHWWDSSLT